MAIVPGAIDRHLLHGGDGRDLRGRYGQFLAEALINALLPASGT
jgi:hypothetical protein